MIIILKMSFQSGGAILGPPGAPGAPVSIIIVVPEANPLQCAAEHQHKSMLILYELQNLGEQNNKQTDKPLCVISPSEALISQWIMFIQSWWLVKAKGLPGSQTGVSDPPRDT